MIYDFLRLRPKDTEIIGHERLMAQLMSILTSAGVPQDDAHITADVLLMANLRGVDTHGVVNILEYIPMIESGSYTIPQEVSILNENNTIAMMTNGHGLGFVGAYRAMETAIDKARANGVGMASLRDGHHIGMVAYYPMMALKHDMIGMAATNGSRSVRPLYGARARVGTNPIAFAAPSGKERPFILDMSTSTVSGRKIELAHKLGVKMPEGWAVMSDGESLVVPPGHRSEEWAQNPLGNSIEQGGHKGYGLGVMVDILCGVLSGGGFSAQLKFGENMSWFMAINIKDFCAPEFFKKMMDDMITELHSTPPEKNAEKVLVAGDPEAEIYEHRIEAGIPLHNSDIRAIRSLAKDLGAEILI